MLVYHIMSYYIATAAGACGEVRLARRREALGRGLLL